MTNICTLTEQWLYCGAPAAKSAVKVAQDVLAALDAAPDAGEAL